MFTGSNAKAVELYKRGEYDAALREFDALLFSAKSLNVMPRGLYTILSNRAATLIKMNRCSEALSDLEKAESLARKPACDDLPSLLKIFARKGEAFNKTMQPRRAMKAYEEILSVDPSNEIGRSGLDQACFKINLEVPPMSQTLRTLTSSAQHLTPKHAGRDQGTRDIYNFIRIKTDTLLPVRFLSVLSSKKGVFQTLKRDLKLAVNEIRERGLDPRVLVIGSAFILPLTALHCGAYHVTCVEPWMYLALGAKTVLEANGADPSSYSVVNLRPCDLTAANIPVPCNILICDAELMKEAIIQRFSTCDPIVLPFLINLDTLHQTISPNQNISVKRAVQDLGGGGARVLIVGAEDGVPLALITAQEGASVIVACPESECSGARRRIATQQLGSKVIIFGMNSTSDLKPGHLFNRKGANVLIFTDLMSGTQTTRDVKGLQSLVGRNASLLRTEAKIIPNFSIYIQAIQVSPPLMNGMDLASLSCYHWSPNVKPCDPSSFPHKTLSGITLLTSVDLIMESKLASEALVTLDCVESGLMNALLITRSDHKDAIMIKHLESAVLMSKGISLDIAINLSSYHVSISSQTTIPVPRPPWLETWGGGSSIENPHVQRVEYCRLVLAEFKQRTRRNKGLIKALSAEIDLMRMNSKSLFLELSCIDEIEAEIMRFV
jgi:hypothetical protein